MEYKVDLIKISDSGNIVVVGSCISDSSWKFIIFEWNQKNNKYLKSVV